MKRHGRLSALAGCVGVALMVSSGAPTEVSAGETDPVDPLNGLTAEQRAYFLAEMADGSMVLKWPETPYDTTMTAFVNSRAARDPRALPDLLRVPGVLASSTPAPSVADIAAQPHLLAPTSSAARLGSGNALNYQSDHVNYSTLAGVVRVDYSLYLAAGNGVCTQTATQNCFWFNAAQGESSAGVYLHWGPQKGSSAAGNSGSVWKLGLSGYLAGGGFFGGLSAAGNTTVTEGSWHVISLRNTAISTVWGVQVSDWSIYLDNVYKGKVTIAGVFLDARPAFWQEVYETDGPCTTTRQASYFDNVTYWRLLDPTAYVVGSGTVSYDTTCINTMMGGFFGTVVDLRQQARSNSNGDVVTF